MDTKVDDRKEDRDEPDREKRPGLVAHCRIHETAVKDFFHNGPDEQHQGKLHIREDAPGKKLGESYAARNLCRDLQDLV